MPHSPISSPKKKRSPKHGKRRSSKRSSKRFSRSLQGGVKGGVKGGDIIPKWLQAYAPKVEFGYADNSAAAVLQRQQNAEARRAAIDAVNPALAYTKMRDTRERDNTVYGLREFERYVCEISKDRARQKMAPLTGTLTANQTEVARKLDEYLASLEVCSNKQRFEGRVNGIRQEPSWYGQPQPQQGPPGYSPTYLQGVPRQGPPQQPQQFQPSPQYHASAPQLPPSPQYEDLDV